MRKKNISLEKKPRSMDNHVWSIYKSYCNALERGETERAEKLRWLIYLMDFSLRENSHGQLEIFKKPKE